MKLSEIYLLTAFVCSACDGEIAAKELALVKDWTEKSNLFGDIDVETKLNEYVDSINKYGNRFISDFLLLLEESNLSIDGQREVARIAIEMIEADGIIQYSEVKLFKRLRSCLTISDEDILSAMPGKEDYLLPDIKSSDYIFDEEIKFSNISLDFHL